MNNIELNEKVNEVMAASMSATKKRLCLIELGLRKTDVDNLMFMNRVPAQTASGFKYTFGVEIECFVSRAAVSSALVSRNVSFAYESYNHRDTKTHYKFVTDSSVSGLPDPIECVSPILNGRRGGFASLKKTCDALNDAGARVNRSCGLHVHIGVDNLSDEHYANIFKNYKRLEYLVDKIMPESRRGNHNVYAKTLSNVILCDCYSMNTINASLNHDRYYKVNPCSYERHKTIEFRHHSGTTDYEKISNWIKFCAALVEWSKDNILTHYVYDLDDVNLPTFFDSKMKSYFAKRIAELN